MILRKGDFCFAKIVDKPFYCKQTLARGSCSSPLSLRAVLNARRGNLLANSTLARGSCPQLVIANPQRGEAISLPANLVIAMERSDRSNPIASNTCFVFGLLRYARNDKSQDGHLVLQDTSP